MVFSSSDVARPSVCDTGDVDILELDMCKNVLK